MTVDPPQPPYEGDRAFLAGLQGMEVVAVHFVMDYVMLQFWGRDVDDAMFTLLVWPVVSVRGRDLRFGEPGYRDALCGLITRTVTATDASPEDGFQLVFDSTAMRLNPKSEEVVGEEIAMLDLGKSRGFMVWRPGEETFEHLR
jgi:hypothetical protein